jgi:hypothetical protein
MSLDPELGPANTENSAAPVRYSAARHANHVDESPELLRWRADLLMDEMMLGGVDVSAADGVAPRPAQRDGSRFDTGYAPDNGGDSRGGYGRGEVGHDEPGRRETTIYPSPASGRFPEPAASPADETPVGPPRQNPSRQSDETRPTPKGGNPLGAPRDAAPAARDDGAGDTRFDDARFDDARFDDARFDDTRFNGEYRNGDALPDSRAQRAPAAPPRREPTSYRQERLEETEAKSARPAAPPPDAHTEWAHSSEKWDWQDFGATEAEPEDDIPAPFTEYRPQDRQAETGSAVRQDPAVFVNAMSVVGGKRRSTLLPRMSDLDPDALNREIAKLHEEIAALLPVGHETNERARHLLDKAYSILQSDPMRSAEVEYYMQQVRTIVQRLRQTRVWSNLYRDRLRVYLLGWLALSAILLAARYVFQLQFEAMLADLMGLRSGSAMVQHWPAFFGSAVAGALGGAAGALYTMRQHTAMGDSFFDRKYGLRGLMLPFMGLFVGALGYLFFGGAYLLAGLNPATNLLAGSLPSLAAFIYGVSQESIFGTRG